MLPSNSEDKTLGMNLVLPEVVEFEGEKMLIVRVALVETMPWKKGQKV